MDETANIDLAAQKIAWGKFSNAGQTCVAPDYVVVHKNVKTQLINSLKQCLENFYGANPRENKDFSRIIDTRHTERIRQLIDKEKRVIGGDFDIENRYIAPTILGHVQWDDKVMEDEIFGQVLPVLEFENLETVITHINSKPKPLSLYLFTRNKAVEERIINSVSFGGGCINDAFIHLGNPYLPFGGVGNSGMGSYHGKRSFETFSHEKSILKRRINIKFMMMHPPYDDKKLRLVRMFLK